MRNYIIGLILGIILTLGFSVGADSFIGKIVQTTLPLIIEGERAEKDVIVVEGSSYIPLKFAGEIFSYDTSYNSESKEVHMKKKVSEDDVSIISNNDIKLIQIKSNDIDIYANDKEAYVLNIEGEYYIALRPLGLYVEYQSPDKLHFLLFENEFEIAIDGTGATRIDGRVYVNLSKLGLTTIYDEGSNTLWLNKASN